VAGADAADVPHRHAAQALEAPGDAVTDEAARSRPSGLQPLLVEAGSAQNFKVTYPEDFAMAEAVLRKPPKDMA
jgi:2-C-methyl-D-erythritol 4-phosphate cytidylyltransferase